MQIDKDTVLNRAEAFRANEEYNNLRVHVRYIYMLVACVND